ncbi:Hsp20/alpha crystallin family protein [Candidatus Azambacteria bacterium]|nr:Hsp20/alpha crystallin family protein [Candidatus Azambacteria bacterium]
MALIPWKPFGDLDRFFGEDEWMAPMFPRMTINQPAMDVYETEKDVVAELNLPNIDPSKINVTVEDNTLRVSGSMEEKKEEKKKDYWRKEIRKGSFERMVRLPVAVKKDKVEATYEKGVLKVVMPKAVETKKESTKVKVKPIGK